MSRDDAFFGAAGTKPAERVPGARPAMVEFRKRDNDWRAYPYGQLAEVHREGGEALVLTFGRSTVKVRGKRLDELYDGFVRQTLERLEEAADEYGDVQIDFGA
jgi:hypothetical protein